MRDVVAFGAVALGVMAGEPEFVGDARCQRAEGDDRDGGGVGGAGEFGGASGGAAVGSQGGGVIGERGGCERQGGRFEGDCPGGAGEGLWRGGSLIATRLTADFDEFGRLVDLIAGRAIEEPDAAVRP